MVIASSLFKKMTEGRGRIPKKRARRFPAHWDSEFRQDYVTLDDGRRYYLWDRYYPRKDRALAHKRKLLTDPSIKRNNWGFKVLKTQHGWGVFFAG